MDRDQAERVAAAAIAAAMTAMNQPPQAPQGPVLAKSDWFAEFKRIDPPKFHGDYNPEGAHKWLQRIEEVFSTMRCPDNQRALLVAGALTGEAEQWWALMRQILEVKDQSVAWEVFKRRFRARYFPVNVLREKEAEFLRLNQGAMSVTEYATKFEDLIRYAPDYRDVDDRVKCFKFGTGLRKELWIALERYNGGAFSQFVNMCSIYEEGLKQEASEGTVRNVQSAGGPIKGKGKANDDVTVPEAKPLCPHCRKFHHGVCWYVCKQKKLCFRCSQPGHNVYNCPDRSRAQAVSKSGYTPTTAGIWEPTYPEGYVLCVAIFRSLWLELTNRVFLQFFLDAS